MPQNAASDQVLHCATNPAILYTFVAVAWPERNYFYPHPAKGLKSMPRFAPKIGASLKGKNLLPEGANSFL